MKERSKLIKIQNDQAKRGKFISLATAKEMLLRQIEEEKNKK